MNALGVKTIKKRHDQDVASGDIEAGAIVEIVYDGTNFQMTSQSGDIVGDIDGDKLDIDWNPSNYTPDSSISEADDADDLSAHLKGIDDKLLTNENKFGGDGSDGALSVSSGTTTIDLSSASVVVKNYTSISITGTGVIDFTNPHANGTTIIFRSQGNVTISSTTVPAIDLNEMGAQEVTLGTSSNVDLSGSAGRA